MTPTRLSATLSALGYVDILRVPSHIMAKHVFPNLKTPPRLHAPIDRPIADPISARQVEVLRQNTAEFGIVKDGQNLAGLLVFLPDVHALGLNTAQGLMLTETFYWDLNDNTRAWSRRFAAANGNKYPSMVHAGVYSSVLHYLKAVDAGKTDDGTKVAAKMKELPTDDILFGKVNTPDDLLADPHLAAMNMFPTYEHPTEGKLRMLGFPISFSATPNRLYRLLERN